MKCLLVEDDLLARQVLHRHLSTYAQCDVAVNGVEAIQAFHKALTEKDPYRFILLDIMMPDMDGHETLQKIHQIECQQGIKGEERVKVVIVTAIGTPQHIQKALIEGCEAYLVKPIEKKKLIEELTKLDLIQSGINHSAY